MSVCVLEVMYTYGYVLLCTYIYTYIHIYKHTFSLERA